MPSEPPASTDVLAGLGRITRLLCWTGGIDPEGLARPELHRRLAGPVLLYLTGALAFVSGSLFAHDLVHLGVPLSILAGVFFAVFVFCLDRMIVLSLDRQHGARRLATGIIRFSMAVLLGYVVAEPIVLRIFSTEIESEMVAYAEKTTSEQAEEISKNAEYGDDALRAANDLVAKTRAKAATTGADLADVAADPEVARLEGLLAETETARRAQQAKVECESDGTCGTGKFGSGPEWTRKRGELDRLQAEADQRRQEIDAARAAATQRLGDIQKADAGAASNGLAAVEAALEQTKARRAAAEDASRKAIEAEDGLGARMDALTRLRATRESIGWEWWVVTLLLITIDTSPVLLKLMQPPTADDEVHAIQRSAQIQRQRWIQRHQSDQLQVTLEEDAALAGQMRAAVRQHDEEQIRTFLDQVPDSAGAPNSPGNTSLPAQAASEFEERLGARAWRPNLALDEP